jgi:molybdate transport system ATP-binding protein
MTLDADVQVSLGQLELDVEVAVTDGETVVVLGPNGAGKTTLLRAIAGLTPLDHGHVTIDGTVVDEPASKTFVSTETRSIGVVFQDYLLFPHLSALDNVAFGVRAHGQPRRVARERAFDALLRVGLDEQVNARPSALSGGQAQRVALARALVLEPRLLLLDEPLAALDATTRVEVRRELRSALEGFEGARIVVTHDPIDAWALATRVIVLEDGKVRQTGTLADLRARPRSRYIADLLGVNLYRGVLRGACLRAVEGSDIVVINDDNLEGEAFAVIHPEAVAVHIEQPAGSPRNTWRGTITDLDDQGRRVRLRIEGSLPITAEITPDARAALGLRMGSQVWVTVKATEIATYAA